MQGGGEQDGEGDGLDGEGGEQGGDDEGLQGEGDGLPLSEEEQAAAWEAYFDWAAQQDWGPDSERTGSEQFQAMVDKLAELGLPVEQP